MIRVIEELEPKQKTTIKEVGFGNLLQIQCRKIDHGLCLWLIDSFNLNTYMLELYNTCIKLSSIDVEFIMGLRVKKYCDKKGRLPLVMLENEIKYSLQKKLPLEPHPFEVNIVLNFLWTLQ